MKKTKEKRFSNTHRTSWTKGPWVPKLTKLAVILLLIGMVAALASFLVMTLGTEDWDEIASMESDPYIVVFYHPQDDDFFSDQIRTLAENARRLEDKEMEIHLLDATKRLRGDVPDLIDLGITPQMWLFDDGEVETVVTGYHAMREVFNRVLDPEKELPEMKPGHVHHWDDTLMMGGDLYFVYYYEETSDTHEEMKDIIKAFKEDNPLGIDVHYLDKKTAWGYPPTELEPVPHPIFGIPMDPYLAGPGGIFIFHDKAIVGRAMSRSAMKDLIESVYDGTFEIEEDD